MVAQPKVPIVLKTLTSEDFKAALRRAGYSENTFADAVGVSHRTAFKWANGTARVPGCVVVLLALLDDTPEIRTAIDRLGSPATRARDGGQQAAPHDSGGDDDEAGE